MKKTYITPEGVELMQLGTFAAYIEGQQFRFVVTQEHATIPPAVTHRFSGKRVCSINHTTQAACLGDLVGAAKLSLRRLIDTVGETRVRSVLADAEKQS